MNVCSSCSHYLECQNIDIPQNILADIIDMIVAKQADKTIEATIMQKHHYSIEFHGINIHMLRKKVAEFEDDCISHRSNLS